MCAIPPVRSTLRRVVGFVLAAMLANVLGSERYDDEERDGDGEGGALGGMGLTEASSSASSMLRGDHVDSSKLEVRLGTSKESRVRASTTLLMSSSLREMTVFLFVLPMVLGTLLEARLLRCLAGTGTGAVCGGPDERRWESFGIGDRESRLSERVAFGSEALLARTVPANLRWNQLRMGLLDLLVIFFI